MCEARLRNAHSSTSALAVGIYPDQARATIAELDVAQARQETSRFIRDPSTLEIWSPEFFREITEKIEIV